MVQQTYHQQCWVVWMYDFVHTSCIKACIHNNLMVAKGGVEIQSVLSDNYKLQIDNDSSTRWWKLYHVALFAPTLFGGSLPFVPRRRVNESTSQPSRFIHPLPRALHPQENSHVLFLAITHEYTKVRGTDVRFVESRNPTMEFLAFDTPWWGNAYRLASENCSISRIAPGTSAGEIQASTKIKINVRDFLTEMPISLGIMRKEVILISNQWCLGGLYAFLRLSCLN